MSMHTENLVQVIKHGQILELTFISRDSHLLVLRKQKKPRKETRLNRKKAIEDEAKLRGNEIKFSHRRRRPEI